MSKQPWIYSSWVDLVFIILPPFAILAILFGLPEIFEPNAGISPFIWLILIVGIDVSHVYSTLYRTYFDPQARTKYGKVLLLIPLLCFLFGVLIYSLGNTIFWRCLAYLAVFHFIRQQYGFMRIYSRKELSNKWNRRLDGLTIYSATLYPILYWHFSGDRNFEWFVEGDFFQFQPNRFILDVGFVIYILILLSFLVKEIKSYITNRYLNWPKCLIILGTIVSWYFGIVHFNGDLAFTLMNVVAHGIPYMALIWIYRIKMKRNEKNQTKFSFKLYKPIALLSYLIVLFVFAFAEEGIWDALVWKDHPQFFSFIYSENFALLSAWLPILIPLLALPQMTHYVLDGFIWKVSRKDVQEELGVS